MDFKLVDFKNLFKIFSKYLSPRVFGKIFPNYCIRSCKIFEARFKFSLTITKIQCIILILKCGSLVFLLILKQAITTIYWKHYAWRSTFDLWMKSHESKNISFFHKQMKVYTLVDVSWLKGILEVCFIIIVHLENHLHLMNPWLTILLYHR